MSTTDEIPAVVPSGPLPYAIVGPPVHKNQWSDQLQTVQSGWEVKAVWKANNAVVTVFVPDGQQLGQSADALIRAQGAQLDELAQLGK